MAVSSRRQNNIRTTVELLGAVGKYLEHPLEPDDCRQRIVTHLREREASTLRVFRDGIYADDTSPYRQLLRHAGITYDDVAELVRAEGVEGTLGRLHRAGVRLSIDEFKGRRTIRRGSVEITPQATDFNNRMPSPHFEVRTGGSRGPGRRLLVDLDLLTHEAAYESCAAVEFGLLERPRALWRPVPPGSAGIKGILKYAKAGLPTARWFSQNPVWSLPEWRHTLFTTGLMMAARLSGHPLAWPEYVPVGQAEHVARWLAESRKQGAAGILNTNAASAVRVCEAAAAHGLDISGSFFRVGGEPYTTGKASVISRAGCRAVSNYAMSEVGRIASACGNPQALDDLHVASDKVAVLARDVFPSGATSPVPGLFLTTLHPSTPKLMINVEVGDYATLSTRACGCIWHRLGQTLYVHGIRSYEKLTADGMHFVGSDLLDLVEQALPAQFGGCTLDYQLVEDERDGVPTVTLVVSPRVGILDEHHLKSVVIDRLGSGSATCRMMANRWRDADTLRVARREPHITAAGKVPTLHVRYADRPLA